MTDEKSKKPTEEEIKRLMAVFEKELGPLFEKFKNQQTNEE